MAEALCNGLHLSSESLYAGGGIWGVEKQGCVVSFIGGKEGSAHC